MANCPNCGVHLKKTYWKPNCPNCNVNIFYNGMQDRLEKDVITAEISLNKMYGVLDRAKASYVGSKLAIARIVLSLLPILALALTLLDKVFPLAKVVVDIPFVSDTYNVSAMTIYNIVSTLDFGALLSLFSSDIVGAPLIFYALSVVFILLGAVASLVGFILIFLSCAPKGIQRNLGFGFGALACYALGGIFFAIFGSQMSGVIEGFSASIGLGFPVVLVAAIAPIIINFLIKKNPIVVKSSAEKRKREIAEKAAQMAADLAEAQQKQEEQRMIEEAYAKEQAEKNKK